MKPCTEYHIHIARDVARSSAERKAAIYALADVEHLDADAMEALSSINDGLGIMLVRNARNAAWSSVESDMRAVDILDAVAFRSPWQDANADDMRRETVEDAVRAAGRMLLPLVVAVGIAMIGVMALDMAPWVRDLMEAWQ